MDHWHSERYSSGDDLGEPDKANYSQDGVDLTLIRWMLSLTPTERLEVLQQSVRSLSRLCNEGSLT